MGTNVRGLKKITDWFDPIAIVVGSAIFIASLVAALLLYNQMIGQFNALIRARLLNTAVLAASLTDGDVHQTIIRQDQKSSAEYARLRAPYMQILRANDDLLYVYTVVKCGRKICIIMDSELPRAGEHIVPSDIMEVYRRPSTTILKALDRAHAEVEVKPYTDEYGTFLSAYAPIYTSDHKYLGLVGVDMSYRRYSAEVLRIREALVAGIVVAGLLSILVAFVITVLRHKNIQLQSKYRAIITNIPAVVFQCQLDQHLTMTFINDYIMTLTGYPASDLIGNKVRDFLSLVPSEDRAAVKAGIFKSLESSDRFEIECRLIPRAQESGSTVILRPIWVRISGVRLTTADDNIPVIEGYMQNVTLRKATEAKVAESERQYRTLADSMPNFLWITNVYGDTIFYNNTWLTYVGATLDDEIDAGWLCHIHPEDKDACLKKFIDALAEERTFQCWFRLLGKDGGYRWLLSVCTPRFSSSGKCDGFISAATDITERKSFEAELRRTNQQLELYFRHTPAAIAVFDNQMRYLMVSERWKTDYDLGDIEVIGRSHYDVFPEVPDRWRELHQRCLSGEIISNPEDCFVRANGETNWMAFALHPWMDDGQTKGMIMFTEVVTERKLLDDELKQHRDHLETLVAAQTHQMRLETDKNILLRTLITSANEARDLQTALEGCLEEICQYTGWKMGHCYRFDDIHENLVSTRAWSAKAHSDYADVVQWVNQFALPLTELNAVPVKVANTGAKVWLKSHDFNNPSSRTFKLHAAGLTGVVAFPICIAGEVKGVFEFFDTQAIVRDNGLATLLIDIGLQMGRVFERFQNEQRLRSAKEVAEQSVRAKSDFLSNMSHELRTPMHAILNYAGMGQKRLSGLSPENDGVAKLDKYFGNIQTAGKRLLDLLNNLLDLAKLESGKMTFAIEAHDLLHVVDQTVMELDPLLKAKSLRLEINNEAPSTIAPFDRPKLVQVAINLFSNAIKFSPEGSTLHVAITATQRDDTPVLRFTLTDEGLGIPDGELEQIFEPFIQSSHTKSGAGGTGLGLSICKKIISAHSGRIWAENAPGKGARLSFDLPRDAICGRYEAVFTQEIDQIPLLTDPIHV
ncbi:hypothetical protein ABENE_06785 [Asticcacaulis benevestitus DSM 16100 = ATCC BAA-896]|uniref:histidine kinase n=1 Tax=Asticcacaulis benevestitus DSM 16100 = ATCC BAA-896 TaxID=1121022 RepID=V4PWQ5_9CAUL|nr:hypothetical protein ABENE_06785 [Asticcacaulis benevestitus DSM 16100 = ATCC BAA-896]